MYKDIYIRKSDTFHPGKNNTVTALHDVNAPSVKQLDLSHEAAACLRVQLT